MLLVTVAAGLLLISLDNSILYTALPTLSADLGATGSQSLWIINAYPVVMAGLLLGSGTLGDRVGHRRMFLIGLVIFGFASLCAAFAPTATILIIARALLAVGAAAMMPATLALIRVTFEIERERNLAIAVWGSVAVAGAASGPIVGGFLLEHFWWGSVFLINVPVVAIAILATVLIAPANSPDPSKTWDVMSSLQAMAGLIGAVVLLKELAHAPQNWALIAAGALTALTGSVLFVRRQRHLAVPLVDFHVFRTPAFSAGVLAAGFAMFAIGGSQLATTQRFQLVAGFTPLQAGLLVSIVAIASLPTALLGAAFLHRTGLRILITGGLGTAAAAMGFVVLGVTTDHWPLLIGALIAGGLGLGAVMSVASIAIMGNVTRRRAGMASAIEEVSYEMGSLTAVALLGSLLTFVYTANVRLPEGVPAAAGESIQDALLVADGDPVIITAARSAFDTGYAVTMIALVAVLALGTIATGWLLRHHGPGTPSQAYGHEAHDAPQTRT
ncbi:MAG: MFS transporter [Micrococcus sp.]|nr:MFS transporter [Micrococcus sp.]